MLRDLPFDHRGARQLSQRIDVTAAREAEQKLRQNQRDARLLRQTAPQPGYTTGAQLNKPRPETAH
jgi:hypothetical protein